MREAISRFALKYNVTNQWQPDTPFKVFHFEIAWQFRSGKMSNFSVHLLMDFLIELEVVDLL